MDGARGLAAGTLQGKLLINLDTEEWGHFYLGCAGGVDVEVRCDCEQEAVPDDYALLRFDVSGLRGGHSGIDIHLGRGNAIKLLAEALRDLAAHTDVRLIEMQGGSARNAIPREAFAVCAVPSAAVPGINEWVEHRLAAWQQRFAATDAKVGFRYELDEMPVSNAIRRPRACTGFSRQCAQRRGTDERGFSRCDGYLQQSRCVFAAARRD